MQPASVGRPHTPPGSSSVGPALRLPPVIRLLLLALIIITAVMHFADPLLETEIIITFGLYLFLDGQFQWQRLYSLVTSIFLHDGWLHLLFNGLWIATLGSLVHRALGNIAFLILFFVSATAGGLAYTFLNWGQTAVAIGASGGVFGLIGAFGHLGVAKPDQPRKARLKSLFGFTVIMMFLNLAYAYLGAPGSDDAQIAWEAHAGGFLAGLLLMPLLYRYRLRRQLLMRR